LCWINSTPIYTTHLAEKKKLQTIWKNSSPRIVKYLRLDFYTVLQEAVCLLKPSLPLSKHCKLAPHHSGSVNNPSKVFHTSRAHQRGNFRPHLLSEGVSLLVSDEVKYNRISLVGSWLLTLVLVELQLTIIVDGKVTCLHRKSLIEFNKNSCRTSGVTSSSQALFGTGFLLKHSVKTTCRLCF
jgi:hypothetical protein